MPKQVKDNSDLVSSILEAAEQHGHESAGMEVVDLQQALQIVWKILTPEQRQAAYNEVVETLGWDE